MGHGRNTTIRKATLLPYEVGTTNKKVADIYLSGLFYFYLGNSCTVTKSVFDFDADLHEH